VPLSAVPPRHPYVAFFLLGLTYVALGVAWWFHDRAGIDLWLTGVGVFVLLIGAGLYLAFTRFFPAGAQ
jgi:hypothetical protein